MRKSIATVLCLAAALLSLGCGTKKEESTGKGAKICIDGIFYVNTGMEAPVEPEESAIEYVEIPMGGEHSGMITAFAEMHGESEDCLACRIDEKWYRFVAEK